MKERYPRTFADVFDEVLESVKADQEKNQKKLSIENKTTHEQFTLSFPPSVYERPKEQDD